MKSEEYSNKCYEVFSSVFGEEFSKKRFYHKHFNNPYKDDNPIRVCIKDDKYVAITAFMKMNIVDNLSDKRLIHIVSQSNDAAILKEYRGQRIFSKIIFDELENMKTECVIGIPNDISYPRFMKMGWGVSCEFTNYFYALRLFRLLIGNNFLSRILDNIYKKTVLHKMFLSKSTSEYEMEITDKLELTEEEWKEVNDSFEVGIQRSQEYIDWKMFGNGNNPKSIVIRKNGNLIGYVIYHIRKRYKGKSARIDDFYIKDTHNIWPQVFLELYEKADIIEDPLVNCNSKDAEFLITAGMKDIRKYDKKKQKQKLIVSPQGKEEEYLKKLQMRMIDFDIYMNK